MQNADQNDDGPLYDRPSKSQVKRELLAILELGKQVVELPMEKVKQLDLDEKTLEAIRTAQKTTGREGRRRQIHYVGKLLRTADTAAIAKKMDEWEHGSREQTANMHRMETLRDRLIDEDEALTRLLNDYPQADAQALRTLIRGARREREQNAALPAGHEQQRKHYRALFQAIKLLLTKE